MGHLATATVGPFSTGPYRRWRELSGERKRDRVPSSVSFRDAPPDSGDKGALTGPCRRLSDPGRQESRTLRLDGYLRRGVRVSDPSPPEVTRSEKLLAESRTRVKFQYTRDVPVGTTHTQVRDLRPDPHRRSVSSRTERLIVCARPTTLGTSSVSGLCTVKPSLYGDNLNTGRSYRYCFMCPSRKRDNNIIIPHSPTRN